MCRLTLLSVVLAAMLPAAPFGCPPAGNGDSTLDPRETLATTAEADKATARVGEAVALRASANGDPAGGTVHYAWIQTDGPGAALTNAEQAQATFTAPSIETERYATFAVTTRNDAGAVGRAEVRVLIEADPDYQPYDWGDGSGGGGNTGPIANAGSDQRILPNEIVTLDGSESTGQNLSHEWRQVSGPSVTLVDGNTATATFEAPGYDANGDNVMVFELFVTDQFGRTVTDRVKITVRNPDVSDRLVHVETTMGNFTIELYPDDAPVTVENFLQYIDDEFYDGTIFHRVIAGFVVQGGGFLPGLDKKETRDPIVNEADNGLLNNRTYVAMARTNDPDSATSQWYVNLDDNDFLNQSQSNAGYTVFGKVVEGMDVVDRIAEVETGSEAGFDDVPVNDVIINRVYRADVSEEQ